MPFRFPFRRVQDADVQRNFQAFENSQPFKRIYGPYEAVQASFTSGTFPQVTVTHGLNLAVDGYEILGYPLDDGLSTPDWLVASRDANEVVLTFTNDSGADRQGRVRFFIVVT